MHLLFVITMLLAGKKDPVQYFYSMPPDVSYETCTRKAEEFNKLVALPAGVEVMMADCVALPGNLT